MIQTLRAVFDATGRLRLGAQPARPEEMSDRRAALLTTPPAPDWRTKRGAMARRSPTPSSARHRRRGFDGPDAVPRRDLRLSYS
jgi:hypothetical protein